MQGEWESLKLYSKFIGPLCVLFVVITWLLGSGAVLQISAENLYLSKHLK